MAFLGVSGMNINTSITRALEEQVDRRARLLFALNSVLPKPIRGGHVNTDDIIMIVCFLQIRIPHPRSNM